MGKKTMGTSAVAKMGIASDIHQIAINKETAAAFFAEGDIPEGEGKSIMIKKTINPVSNPRCLFEIIF
jgi:hypothetical protein